MALGRRPTHHEVVAVDVPAVALMEQELNESPCMAHPGVEAGVANGRDKSGIV